MSRDTYLQSVTPGNSTIIRLVESLQSIVSLPFKHPHDLNQRLE